MFLPATRLTPVFPPIDASTWASTVVGICTNSTPRIYSEANKPLTSPTTPPPRAMITALRSAPSRTSLSARASTDRNLHKLTPAHIQRGQQPADVAYNAAAQSNDYSLAIGAEPHQFVRQSLY